MPGVSARCDRPTWPRSLIAAVMLIAGCSAAPAPTPPSADSLVPVRSVLANGMRVIVQAHRASQTVAIHLWVGVGARDEGPDERGFSHFVEHMLFKGTEVLSPGFLDREVEAVGGRANAGTSWDYTFYYMLLPAERAKRGVQVLADMAFNSRFDPAELGREREVIFEEVRLGEDNPRSFLARKLYEVTFANHAYGRPVLGDPAAMRAATRETLKRYYRRHYTADNMVLVVVGAVDADDIRRTAERLFGAFPAEGVGRRMPVAPSVPDGGQRVVVRRPERQAMLAVGWTAPSLGHQDMYAVHLLAHILGGSRSSRLNQALRERTHLVSAVHAGYSSLQLGGLVAVTAQCQPDDVDRVEAALLAEVRRIQAEGVTEDERERAMTAAEAQHAFSVETAEGRAHAYGLAETLWSLGGELRYLERIRNVTGAEIREAARKYLGRPHARVALLPRDKTP